MISAWRIVKRRLAATAVTGEGGMHAAGRWHDQGVRIVYCASSLSLAALELLVHLERSAARIAFVSLRVQIPTSVRIEELRREDLPRDWRREPPSPATRQLGMKWLRASTSAVLRVPSAIIPSEHNYLLNPANADFARLAIGAGEPFTFDPRLRKA